MKIGMAVVPPVLFAGTRFLAAGLLPLAAYQCLRLQAGVGRGEWGQLLLVSFLMVSFPYALLFWGAQHVSTGVAAAIDPAVLSVALLAFGVLVGQERLDVRRLLALALGSGRLMLLFAGSLSVRGSVLEAWAASAILLSALLYAARSVLARPLLATSPALIVSGWALVTGGGPMTAGAVAFEPGARAALDLR